MPIDKPCEVRGLVTTGSAADNCKQKAKLNISGCSAVGSARALGAGHRPLIMKFRKMLKNLVNIGFFGTILSRKFLYKNGLTTCLTTYGKTAKIQYFLPFGVWRSW